MAVTDPLYSSQWHFGLIGDIETIWQEYTGAGINVGIYDDGVEASHEDLNANYDESLEWAGDDGLPNGSSDGHGTSVAGIIAADNNGLGGVGVAYDASIGAVDFLNDVQYQNWLSVQNAFHHGVVFDVINNSWGTTPQYADWQDMGDAGSSSSSEVALADYLTANGRGGLGTIVTKAAGNEAHDATLQGQGYYGNAAGEGLNNAFSTITIAATDSSGNVAY
ncbi:MAG TPA: hypothetical protein ENK83_05160, partial [Aliiroseovarius sp.]|nr:hypothetical protein [Aliiroseovarius sp.]